MAAMTVQHLLASDQHLPRDVKHGEAPQPRVLFQSLVSNHVKSCEVLQPADPPPFIPALGSVRGQASRMHEVRVVFAAVSQSPPPHSFQTSGSCSQGSSVSHSCERFAVPRHLGGKDMLSASSTSAHVVLSLVDQLIPRHHLRLH